MISCQDFCGFLCDLVSGQLSAEIRQEVEQHLGACPRCRAELDQYKDIIRLARALPAVNPPHGLLLRYRAAFQAGAPKPEEAPTKDQPGEEGQQG